MRKLIVVTMITIDGVMEAPNRGPNEHFKYAGWIVPYVDESLLNVIDEELNTPIDLLIGKTTYDIFAPYWPNQTGTIADAFNKATKYVVSDKPVDLAWKESILIEGDVAAKIKALKKEEGPALQVHGSGRLVQTLLKNDLVDELHLRIFPVTIGTGQRLFEEGTIPAAFELIESGALPSGIIIANYKRAGELKTGSLE